MDVLIKFEDLGTLNDYLKQIIAEFDAAEDRADQLEAAIGDPYGRNDLREAVEDFEDRWDDKRDELRDGMKACRSTCRASSTASPTGTSRPPRA